MQNRQPVIFSEYYSHENCDCYKILMPFSKYASTKLVLCKVDEGIDKAREIARKAINERIEQVLKDNAL